MTALSVVFCSVKKALRHYIQRPLCYDEKQTLINTTYRWLRAYLNNDKPREEDSGVHRVKQKLVSEEFIIALYADYTVNQANFQQTQEYNK